MRVYLHATIAQVLETGLVSEADLTAATRDGRLNVVTEEATGKKYVSGLELKNLFGIDKFSYTT